MFSSLDLSFLLCSLYLDVLHTQRIIGIFSNEVGKSDHMLLIRRLTESQSTNSILHEGYCWVSVKWIEATHSLLSELAGWLSPFNQIQSQHIGSHWPIATRELDTGGREDVKSWLNGWVILLDTLVISMHLYTYLPRAWVHGQSLSLLDQQPAQNWGQS